MRWCWMYEDGWWWPSLVPDPFLVPGTCVLAYLGPPLPVLNHPFWNLTTRAVMWPLPYQVWDVGALRTLTADSNVSPHHHNETSRPYITVLGLPPRHSPGRYDAAWTTRRKLASGRGRSPVVLIGEVWMRRPIPWYPVFFASLDPVSCTFKQPLYKIPTSHIASRTRAHPHFLTRILPYILARKYKKTCKKKKNKEK